MQPDFSEAARTELTTHVQSSLEHYAQDANSGYVWKDRKCIKTQRWKTQECGKRLPAQELGPS